MQRRSLQKGCVLIQKAVAERKPENWDWNPDLCDTGVALGGKP